MDILKKYFHLTPHQEQQFAALGELYPEWNQKINVISRKDTENLQHPPFTTRPFPNPVHGLRPPGEKFYSWGGCVYRLLRERVAGVEGKW